MTVFGPLSDDCPTEDELITFRALMLGRNAFLPQVGVLYRKHSASSSNPGNFAKFPLEKILGQQFADMGKAIEAGLITPKQKEETKVALLKGMARRKIYRRYFAAPTFPNLLRLLTSPLFPLRTKCHFIIDHFRRKRLMKSAR